MITRIKATREHTHMTQKDCADTLGVTLRAWQTYEQGIREPKFELLVKIADMFNVSTDYLLGRDTGEPAPIDALAGSFNMSALEQKILEGYLNLPAAMRGDLMNFLQNAVREVMRDTQEES